MISNFRISMLSLGLFVLLMPLAAMGDSVKHVRTIHLDGDKSATAVEVVFDNGQKRVIDFYDNHIFRVFQDPQGGGIRPPQAKPEAHILVDQPRSADVEMNLVETDPQAIVLKTPEVEVRLARQTGLMSVVNKQGRKVMEELQSVSFDNQKVTLRLRDEGADYFGGGVQNGRFSHRGQQIQIVNQNSWTDGGVASPCPFFWSTGGYGMMFHTFKPGMYDFQSPGHTGVTLSHNDTYLDVFVMVNTGAVPLLNDYYQLTGHPVLLPKFGFYEGHLNAYNRDYWKETSEGGILFEDGKRYVESQNDNGGIKESLNGELPGNYQFSARAVIDRYKKHDMPLGWILPNDGYGAGYGQTSTLDGNIKNLKELGDYARKNGVEIGLWTQSDLHPVDSIQPLLQRDIVKEIGEAGVRVLKTDVAWVGDGYSFGLNGIADVAQLMPKYGKGARPFIITLDGWAGTQRYAGVWTGDQTGGKWEYIRFHIPTYIGAGLSGMPNITSDMDGIFGGKNPIVNVRDFQWKMFTPMQLNMDGWGSNPKYPHEMGEPYTSINRNYLKIKSIMMPYIYSVAHESVNGKPMMRAMFLEESNRYTLGKQTQYQFMFGPFFLIAPIYQNTAADAQGNDIRNGIYLPKGRWYDLFSGRYYEGGCVLNNFEAPIWKLPLFLKAGAILPITYAHNNPNEIRKGIRSYEMYPYGESQFVEYDDDGRTDAYLRGDTATTLLRSSLKDGVARLTIEPTKGHFEGMETMKKLTMTINVWKKPKSVVARLNGKKVKLKETHSMEEFAKYENAVLYTEESNMNAYSTPGTPAAKVKLPGNYVVYIRMGAYDITKTKTEVVVKGYDFEKPNDLRQTEGELIPPTGLCVPDSVCKAYSLEPHWNKVYGADFYEIRYDDMLYTGIRNTWLPFEGLEPETDYTFQVRAVNKSGESDWTTFSTRTAANPLEFAITDISALCSAASQPGAELRKLFDLDETTMWHSKWQTQATPFELIADLHTVNTLDRMEYLPRQVGANGIFTEGKVSISLDRQNWTEVGNFKWLRDNQRKTFVFAGNPQARYVKLSVEKAYGGFGSGQELLVFRKAGTTSFLPGDINNDQVIDENDLTSYLNYTGLRLGDKDFEGYVSKGDINQNNLIDAYDILNAAVKVGRPVVANLNDTIEGRLLLVPDKKSYKVGDEVVVTVRGLGLKNVNGLSFALALPSDSYEYQGIELKATKGLENYTNNRLHSNGSQVLYPTLVNVGQQSTLNGSDDLFVLRFKALKAAAFSLRMTDGLLVNPNLIQKILE